MPQIISGADLRLKAAIEQWRKVAADIASAQARSQTRPLSGEQIRSLWTRLNSSVTLLCTAVRQRFPQQDTEPLHEILRAREAWGDELAGLHRLWNGMIDTTDRANAMLLVLAPELSASIQRNEFRVQQALAARLDGDRCSQDPQGGAAALGRVRIISADHRVVEIDGEPMKPLTAAQFAVVRQLAEAWPKGITLGNLVKKDGPKYLRALAAGSEKWASVIHMPGSNAQGTGYRIG